MRTQRPRLLKLSPRRERQLLAAIVLAQMVLALGFSLGPIFEGPDEAEHYRYARTLARTLKLPNPYDQPRGEYHQAPLAYMLLAPLARLVDDADFPALSARLNPYYGARIHLVGNDNKNRFLHTRTEAFPYTHSPTALVLHLMRLVQVLLGTGTVLAAYAAFRTLWPRAQARRLLALSLVAFWPQRVYLSSVVTNDNLLILLSTLNLWALLRLPKRPLRRREALGWGALLGALMLTKTSAIFSVAFAGALLLAHPHIRRRAPRILAAALLVGGWWYAHNWLRDGDPANQRAVAVTWGPEIVRGGQFVLETGLRRVGFAYRTLWARFGEGAVAVSPWMYTAFDALTVAALLGLGGRALSALYAAVHGHLAPARTRWRALALGGFALSWLAALLYLSGTHWSGNQGRYVLAAVGVWGALLALGLSWWWPRRWRLPLSLALSGALAALTAVALLAHFLPAYRPARPNAPPARPLDYRFGDYAALVGVSPAQPRVAPGGSVRITLYWRALRPADRDLTVYLHTVGTELVRRDSYPANGNLLATDWRVGELWVEHYTLEIPPDAPSQTVWPLIAGLYDPLTQQPLPAYDAQGRQVTPLVGRLAVRGPLHEPQPAYTFGARIGLADWRITVTGTEVALCAEWDALREMMTDYVLFAHLLGPNGALLAQADAAPPYPTAAWSAGERVPQCVQLQAEALPAGWRIALGWYRLEDMARLPAYDRAGQRLPNDAVLLAP